MISHAEITARVAAIHAKFEPGCRPGERWLNGKRYVFDADALNPHIAQEAVKSAPANLSGLTDDQLTGLLYKAVRVQIQGDPQCAAGRALAPRIEAERRRREPIPEAFRSDVYGRRG